MANRTDFYDSIITTLAISSDCSKFENSALRIFYFQLISDTNEPVLNANFVVIFLLCECCDGSCIQRMIMPSAGSCHGQNKTLEKRIMFIGPKYGTVRDFPAASDKISGSQYFVRFVRRPARRLADAKRDVL